MTVGAANASPGGGQIAQARRHVDAVPDVVVTLHEDHVAAGDPRADGDGLDWLPPRRRRSATSRMVSRSGRVSTHTSMTPSPSHLAMRTPRRGQMSTQEGAECGQHVDRPLVPLHLGQGGEARDVHEGEAAMHPHGEMLPCRAPLVPIPAGAQAPDMVAPLSALRP